MTEESKNDAEDVASPNAPEFPIGISGKPQIPVPAYLGLTPERMEEIEREQTLYAQATNTRAELSDREWRIARGRALVEIAQANLELLKKKRHREANPDQRKVEMQRMVEGYAMQGKYVEAVRYARHNPTLRAEYRRIVKALERPDSDKCKCPHDEQELDGVKISVSPRTDIDYVISLPHGGALMPLIVCVKCGHANVRPLDGQAAKLAPLQRAAEASASKGTHNIPQHHASIVLKKEAA